ncbi:MAG: dihydrofolate reductase [Trueperaceae bacterium]|nr:dihydrofolate reductase [Trueperaceae bacterium]
MRKLISFLHSSVDGFVQSKEPWDLGWISYDKDLEAYAREVLSTADTVLWGRVTYLGMYSYWPSVPANPESSQHERDHAAWIEKTAKVVVSTTLDKAEWNNSRLIKDNLETEIVKLKQQEGKDIVILGSPGLTHSLTQLGSIDEYRMTLNPVALGSGVPLFNPLAQRLKLKLVQTKTFDSGALGLHYQTQRGEK